MKIFKGENNVPIYDFKCEKCGRKFERIVKMDETMIDCDGCGYLAGKVKSLSRSNFHLKGKCWAKDNYQ